MKGNRRDVPTVTCVPARGRKTIEYFCFLLQLPTGVRQVGDIRVGKEKILIHGPEGEVVAQLSVPAHLTD
jgi:hypothetical protein